MFKELLCCLILLGPVLSKSIQKRSEDSEEYDMWMPDNGMTREDWLRCNGMTCDKFERTKRKQMRLKILASSPDQDDVKKVMDMDIDSMNDTMLHEKDFDGCIWLTEEQLDEIFEEKKARKHRQKRKIAINALYYKWTFPIRFKFDGAHSESDKRTIRSAVRHVEAQTCVRFQELGMNERYSSNHIIFTKENTGCHSYVGKVGVIPQPINLQAGCIYWYGIIVHEIGHALGLWHEQQREDRDNHIKVLYENLGGYRGQFFKAHSQDDLGVGYDIGSVMHYGPKDGSVDGRKNVMESLNPLFQQNMGQRTGFSFNDAKIINKAYCQAQCNQPLNKPCQHGGYQDPNDCSRCRCAPGFGGKYCDQLADSNDNCGGTINLNSGSQSTQYITSPGYERSQPYPLHVECNWIIKAPANTKIQLSFVDKFRVFCEYQGQCFHWVEVKYKDGLDSQGPRFCCYQPPTAKLVSDSNEMVLMLRSNFSAHTYYRDGFRAKVELIGSPSGTTKSSQSTTKQSTKAASTTTLSTTTPSTTTTTPSTTTTTTSTTTTVRPTTTTTTAAPTPSTTSGPQSEECIKVDLSFLLDSSGSVKLSGWKKTLEFVTKSIEKLQLSNLCAQVSIISIGSEAYFNFPLKNNLSKKDLIGGILALPFKDEWTSTGDAFVKLVSEVYTKNKGARDGVQKVAVLITDGKSNRGADILKAAETARQQGIEIIGIGVDNVDRDELEKIVVEQSCVRYVGFKDIILPQFIQDIISKIKDLIDMPTMGTEEYYFKCTFENNTGESTWCGIKQSQSDRFDWTMRSGRTPSDETGPKRAYNGNYYVYIETSSPRKPKDNAILELPVVPAKQKYCLTFNYHMYGFHIRTLAIYAQTSSRKRVLMKQDGERGNDWMDASLETNMDAGDKILIEGVRGKEYSGDIAIDNIILQSC